MDLQRLDGPRLNPLSSAAPRQLVVLLHGYGADGADLIGIGRQWQRQLPDAAFVSPNAPQFCENPPMGYQWFGLRLSQMGVVWTPEDYLKAAANVAPIIDNFLDQELARQGVAPERLVLAGFSQGAIMSLHTGLRRKTAPAAIVSYSGMLLGADRPREIVGKPPVFLAHGSLDDVVPYAYMQPTQEALQLAGVEVTPYIEEGVGHGIDGEAVYLAGEFLKARFAARKD